MVQNAGESWSTLVPGVILDVIIWWNDILNVENDKGKKKGSKLINF